MCIIIVPFMDTERINISLPKEILVEIAAETGPRGRSRFILEAVRGLLKERRDQRLADEYRAAAADIRRINRDLEGTLGDGLD